MRGRLEDPDAAPPAGERVERVAAFRNVVVEQILSGELHAPADYAQDHDEWVVVLAGGATLELDGETMELSAGDWLFLRAGLPHRLVRTQPGTSWLAVRAT